MRVGIRVPRPVVWSQESLQVTPRTLNGISVISGVRCAKEILWLTVFERTGGYYNVRGVLWDPCSTESRSERSDTCVSLKHFRPSVVRL